ncbi:MAG: DM13 domain-containing protein [Pseudomonadota bacterium]
MLKSLKIALPSFLIGAVAGAAGWYLFSPLFIDQVVDEVVIVSEESQVLASGSFRDADRVHRGMGEASFVRQPDGRVELQLTGFEVTNGPDLKVYLSAHADPERASDVTGNDWISLGALKGNVGDQTYTLPADVDPADFNSVVIWCEAFSVLFSPAALA